MRLRSIVREEELKKQGKSPTHFEIITASERKSLGMESCVVASHKLESARQARDARRNTTRQVECVSEWIIVDTHPQAA
jgi:hypothetical protein